VSVLKASVGLGEEREGAGSEVSHPVHPGGLLSDSLALAFLRYPGRLARDSVSVGVFVFRPEIIVSHNG
jgi:hypothetical protein